MLPWDKRKKELNDEIRMLEQLIDSIINDLISQDFDEDRINMQDKPLVLGFSLKIDAQGMPYFERFGNIKEGTKVDYTRREPLTNVLETEKDFIITFELPGINQENISLQWNDNELSLKAVSEKTFFYKNLRLNAKIGKLKEKRLNNGILEVVFSKKE